MEDEQLLSIDEMLAADDVKTEVVEVPEWPGKDGKPGQVRVRGAMAYEYDEYEASLIATKTVGDTTTVVNNTTNAKARLVVKLLIDSKGKKLVPENLEAQKAIQLGKKSHAAVNRLFQVIQRLSGRGRKTVEMLEGNSETGKTNSFGSSLPATSKDEQ